MSEFKNVDYLKNNYVTITHFLLDEYEDKEEPSYSYTSYKKQIMKSYNLAQDLGMCEIIQENANSVKIKMVKYNIIIDNINIFIGKNDFPENFCRLLEFMFKNNIVHLDFAPRNLGVDTDGEFKLIDLNEIYVATDVYKTSPKKCFEKWLDEYECEFTHAGLGNEFNEARKLFMDKIDFKL